MRTASPVRKYSGLGGAAVLLLAAVILFSGCGKSAPESSTTISRSAGHGATGGSVTPGAGVPASAVAVIKGWADALRDGQLGRAAAYWADPSVMVNGTEAAGRLGVIRIKSEHDAFIADESLSCGATLRSATRNGAYVLALFTLSTRTGVGASSSGCAGPAGVDFLIRKQHIVRWLRAPITPHAPRSEAPGESEAPGGGAKPGLHTTHRAQSS